MHKVHRHTQRHGDPRFQILGLLSEPTNPSLNQATSIRTMDIALGIQFKHGTYSQVFGHTKFWLGLDPTSFRLTVFPFGIQIMYNLPASIPMKFFSPKRLPLTKHLSIMAHNKISIYHRIMTVTPYWKSITMCHNWNSFTQNLLHGITFLSGSSVLISLHHNFNLFFLCFSILETFS